VIFNVAFLLASFIRKIQFMSWLERIIARLPTFKPGYIIRSGNTASGYDLFPHEHDHDAEILTIAGRAVVRSVRWHSPYGDGDGC